MGALRTLARDYMRVALIAVGMLAATAVRAAADDVTMSVHCGFDDFARTGWWSPVTVELTNNGRDRNGQLVLSPLDPTAANLAETRACTVRLPNGSRQRYDLYCDQYGSGLPPAAFFPGAKPREAQVRTVSDDDSLVVAIGFTPGALQFLWRTHRVRLWDRNAMQTSGMSPGAMRVYRGSSSPATAGQVISAHISPRDAPESPLVYYQADLVVLGPMFASDLSSAAQSAIVSWVRTGGNLVITGGADAARLQHPFFRALLPVEGLHSISLAPANALAAYGAPVGQPTALAAGVPVAGAQVLAQQGGVPLIVRARVGAGSVTFLAFDPSEAPLSGWNGQDKLWLSMFDDKSRMYSLRSDLSPAADPWSRSQVSGQLLGNISGLKQLEVPPMSAIIGFLVLYFAALSPINYWVLGHFKRRDLAWLTTPAIVAVFFVGAYGFAYMVKGPQLLIKQATIVEAGEGSSEALAQSFFGVFSPARRSYDIRVGLPGAIITRASTDYRYSAGMSRRAEDTGVVHDEREPWIERCPVPMWGMRTFSAHGIVNLGGPIRAKLALTGASLVANPSPVFHGPVAGAAKGAAPALPIAGWIENDSPQTLRRAMLVGRAMTNGIFLGDIAPGQRVYVERVGASRNIAGLSDAAMALSHTAPSSPGAAVDLALAATIDRNPVPVTLVRTAAHDAATYVVVKLAAK